MTSWLDRQIQLKSTCKMIKAFFLRLGWKETLIFLFFILLASSFWLLQNLQQEYEIELFIPVKYNNLPEEMGSTAHYPQEIVAKIRDKGTVLFNYTWFRASHPVEVDLTDLRKELSIQVSRRAIEASISKQLISTTSLLNIEPQSLSIEYAALQYKDVPVEIDIAVSLEQGYQISGSMIVVPENVRLFANSNALDTITSIKTAYTEINRANKNQEFTLGLQQFAGIKMEPEEVTVTIPVEEFTEKRITLTVTCNDMPDYYVLRTFPSSVEVVCNVPISRFRELAESDLEIQIPFQEFEAIQTEGRITLYLTKKPLWITHPVIIPDAIEFIIEQNSQ